MVENGTMANYSSMYSSLKHGQGSTIQMNQTNEGRVNIKAQMQETKYIDFKKIPETRNNRVSVIVNDKGKQQQINEKMPKVKSRTPIMR